jgi:hypothetical protein
MVQKLTCFNAHRYKIFTKTIDFKNNWVYDKSHVLQSDSNLFSITPAL